MGWVGKVLCCGQGGRCLGAGAGVRGNEGQGCIPLFAPVNLKGVLEWGKHGGGGCEMVPGDAVRWLGDKR